jgi:hypothetical protein
MREPRPRRGLSRTEFLLMLALVIVVLAALIPSASEVAREVRMFLEGH